MDAIFRRNWLIARRNNLVTLGWLTPAIALLFNWLSTLTVDDPVSGQLGIQTLAVFQPFTVVIIYMFVNSLVTFLAAAFLMTRELDDRALAQTRLSRLTPLDVLGGYFVTVFAVMLPQNVLFHIAVFIYNLTWAAPYNSPAQINMGLVFGVLLMNILNTVAVAGVLSFGLFGKAYVFVVLGGLVAFFMVPANFMLFYVADSLNVSVLTAAAGQIVPLAAMFIFALALGRYRWRTEWL